MTDTSRAIDVLLLAGDRAKESELLDQVPSRRKALLPLAGRPMIAWVLETLTRLDGIGQITIAANDAEEISKALEGRYNARFQEGASSPVASVEDYIKGAENPFPLLILTADNPLVSTDHLRAVIKQPQKGPNNADIVVGMVSRKAFKRDCPDVHRTFHKLSDGAWSGANIFYCLTPAAQNVIHFWRKLEGQRKKPWKIVSSFGFLTVLRAWLGLLSLDSGLKLVSDKLGCTIRAARLNDGWGAMDIDRVEHVKPVEDELIQRQAKRKSL